MEKLHETFGKEVEFLLVYIREAHPVDGWQTKTNEQEKILVTQPKTLEERQTVAASMCTKLEINLPTVIDGLDDAVGQAYSAWPDRLYLVGKNGKIVYKGGPGPRGFKPEELEEALVIETLE